MTFLGAPNQQPPPQDSQNIRMYPAQEPQSKNLPGKVPSQQGLPPTSFADHPAFVGRAIPHPSLYR
jgi:hypothetical protein